MRNAEQSPVAYRLDPEEQYHVFMEMEAAGQEIVAIYHSHPRSPAYPSPRDVEMASTRRGGVPDCLAGHSECPTWRAFRIQEGQIAEAPVTVV